MGRTHREEGLNRALASRKVIGQAIGVMMQRFELDEDRAFEFLVRESSTGSMKLRDVAHQVVDELNVNAQAKG
jgi:AmiR/NasT family two-component response regulator